MYFDPFRDTDYGLGRFLCLASEINHCLEKFSYRVGNTFAKQGVSTAKVFEREITAIFARYEVLRHQFGHLLIVGLVGDHDSSPSEDSDTNRG